MTEIQLQILVVASEDALESNELLFPVPIIILTSTASLLRKVRSSTKDLAADLQRYFILCLESINNENEEAYKQMEESPKVIAIFHVWNESTISKINLTKVYYIRHDLIRLAITYSIIQFLKNEANKHNTLDQIPLSKIYLRRAKTIKEWLMSTSRAEPCHVLVIPLNTDHTNVVDVIQQLERCCKSAGYPSATIRSLDEYIPKDKLYDKMPYGQMVFENEHPLNICRWLRELSPIRMYVYGNKHEIPSEWSKQMIASEIDHVSNKIVNDDDWYIFLENKPVDDKIKWNFYARHAQTWNVSQLAPIKLPGLNENHRFRSALRRAHMTFHARKSIVTAQIYGWFDQCLQLGYIPSEFQLQRTDNPKPSSSSEKADKFSMGFWSVYEKTYSLDSLSAPSYELPNEKYQASGYVYVWLDTNLQLLEERFQMVIHPDAWKSFTDVNECQAFIRNEQVQSEPQIKLLARSSLAEQLFTYEHVSHIHAAYLYSDHEPISTEWTKDFSAIRGIYPHTDSLYEQFISDRGGNPESIPQHPPLQEYRDLLPTGFCTLAGEGLRRYRALTVNLLKSSRSLDAKQEMLDELRREASENGISPEKIDEFEQKYHSHDAVGWYTRESFVCSFINRALRSDNIELISKCRFFIMDLYEALAELHHQIIHSNNYFKQTTMMCYRGSVIPADHLDQYVQNIGSFVFTNAFLSTSLSLSIAVSFAGPVQSTSMTSLRSVLFSIEVDRSIENTRPYAQIDLFSNYEQEEEVLFAIGTVFRIEKVDMLSLSSDIPIICLKIIDETDICELLTEQQISDPTYALVGLTSLFQADEQRERIKSILETLDVQFFESADDLEYLTKSIKGTRSFVVFIHTQSQIPAQYQQTRVISFAENDTHFNDLIYQLLHEMEYNQQFEERVQLAYANLADVYCPADRRAFYVQLLLSPASRNDAKDQFSTQFPSSSVITFYQIDSCLHFLQSIAEPPKIGNAILILQSDEANPDDLIDQFEQVDSVRKIYLCSKNALLAKSRRILHGVFSTEHDLYTQLYSDHVLGSFVEANQQINVLKNESEATRCFEQTEQFQRLLREHLNHERTNPE